MLQFTSMMPWFVGFLFHMFRSCIAKSQPTPTDSEHLESFWGFGCAWGILLSWDLLLAGTGSSPSRCQQGVLGRTSTDAVRGTTLLPYRGVDTEVREKGWEWNWVVVSNIRYFSDGLTPPTRKLIIFPIQNFPRKMTCFSRIVCESRSMSLEKPGQDVCFLWEPSRKPRQPQNSHNVWNFVDSLFSF